MTGNGTIKRLALRLSPAHAASVSLLLLGIGAAHGQLQEDAPIRVNVRLVRILATVKDPSGALVGSLNKDDFQVRDNGVPQNISVFERQTDQPLSVALLIDNSGSTAKDLKYETDSVTRVRSRAPARR